MRSIVAVALALIAIILMASFPGWHEETDDRGSERDVKPFPSVAVVSVALAALVLGSLLSLVSMMWQHTASVAVATTAQDMGYGTIGSEVGAAAMALGWVGLGTFVIPAIGMLVMLLSIEKLSTIDE